MNFIERALKNGFINCTPTHYNYNHNNGWYGVTTQYPDAIFGNKETGQIITLSLQGILMPLPTTNEYDDLINSVKAKYISFIHDGDILYESYTGVIPDEDFLNYFFKE